MTILPKKKAPKDKNDPEVTEHSHAHGHHSASNETRHDKVVRGRTSPTRWVPSTSRDDKLSAHDTGGQFDALDNTKHNKRRHRSPPHRNVRKHRSHASLPQGAGVTTPTDSPEYSYGDEMVAGYNSGDEYEPQSYPENIDELELWFIKTLKEKRGFIIKKMGEDGACLFRAIADQIYGDQEMHGIVRNRCVDYMAKNTDYFSQYVTEEFTTYLNRKRMDNCHGNHVEMQAICELYNRPIEVYQYSIEPINTFHGNFKTDNEPMRISYHKNVHYNSVVDPYKATIGVGLGLPGFQPGLAEKTLMKSATTTSEDFHIEKTMFEDKLRETDWEVTQDTIEEQVARESYLQWLRDNEKRVTHQGATRSASATCSSSSVHSHAMMDTSLQVTDSRSPRGKPSSNQNSPHRIEVGDPPLTSNVPEFVMTASDSLTTPTSTVEESMLGATGGPSLGATAGFQETASLMDQLPATMFGLSDWDEDDILAQVIAQSQQEYLDNLKKHAVTTTATVTMTASCSHSSKINMDGS